VDRPLSAAPGWAAPPWLLDVVALGVAVAVGLGAIANRDAPSGRLVVALALAAAALLLRRRAALVVLGAILALMLALNAASVTTLPALVALLTVAAHRERTQLAGATAATAAALVWVQPLHGAAQGPSSVLAKLLAVALPVVLGRYVRARADYVGGLRDRAERLERERELLARQAAADERVRIARELHDVISHNVSLMVVQAQALKVAAREEPQRAALDELAGLGRRALSEMHRMLGVLRVHDADVAARAPQPGVAALGGLIAGISRTGVEIDLRVEGEPRELPPAVDASAHRIVQEALTNVVRHADARRVTVELAYGSAELRLAVTDDGVGPRARDDGAASPGHGIVGMRERVGLFGGRLEAGAGPGGHGYRVLATLPTR
jgi:signal transduction histidine kinase